MYKKILVPLDGSPLSESALMHAKLIARYEKSEIIILRIPEHIEPKFPAQAYAASIRQQKEANEEAAGYVNDKVANLHRFNFRAEGITREGPVPETILAVAEETHADMIAISSHGWKGLQRLLKGSVAEKVVQNAHIPVMVIHPN
jgi:nucleotide-binding universal stress UspA family protein